MGKIGDSLPDPFHLPIILFAQDASQSVATRADKGPNIYPPWLRPFRDRLQTINNWDDCRAFHKLLEIFQKVSRNFSKSFSKVALKTIKSAFCQESCPKVARKKQNLFWSDAKICKLYNKSKIMAQYFNAMGHLHGGVILILRPESFSLFLSHLNFVIMAIPVRFE